MLKLLLIGPMTNKKDPSKTGGVIVLFEDLLKQCDAMNIDYEVVDTNKSNYPNKSIAFAMILFFSFIKIPKARHVSIHGTAKDYLMIAPSIVFFSKLLGKKISLRKFAGNFDVLYDNFSNIQKKIIDYVLSNSNFNFFETKYLIKKFKLQNEQTFWFPNVREKPAFKREGNYQKKFIFIGQVKEEKGLKEILEVSNFLDDSYTIDVYGSLVENIDFSNYRANYKGTLHPDDVINTMVNYDVLLLPSYREGYPGVLIEAMSLGLPAIATNLEGIKEMIEDEKNGLLIDVKSSKQLEKAIVEISEKQYIDLSKNALKSFNNYDSVEQTDLFLKRIGIYV